MSITWISPSAEINSSSGPLGPFSPQILIKNREKFLTQGFYGFLFLSLSLSLSIDTFLLSSWPIHLVAAFQSPLLHLSSFPQLSYSFTMETVESKSCCPVIFDWHTVILGAPAPSFEAAPSQHLINNLVPLLICPHMATDCVIFITRPPTPWGTPKATSQAEPVKGERRPVPLHSLSSRPIWWGCYCSGALLSRAMEKIRGGLG